MLCLQIRATGYPLLEEARKNQHAVVSSPSPVDLLAPRTLVIAQEHAQVNPESGKLEGHRHLACGARERILIITSGLRGAVNSQLSAICVNPCKWIRLMLTTASVAKFFSCAYRCQHVF